MTFFLIMALVRASVGFAAVPSNVIDKPHADESAYAAAAIVADERGDLCFLSVAGRSGLVPKHVRTAPAHAALDSNIKTCDAKVTAVLEKRLPMASFQNQSAGVFAAAVPVVCLTAAGVGVVDGIFTLIKPEGNYPAGRDGFYIGLGAGAVILHQKFPVLGPIGTGMIGMGCAIAGELAVYGVTYVYIRLTK